MKNFLLKSDYASNKGLLERAALGSIFEYMSMHEDRWNKDCAEFDEIKIDYLIDGYVLETQTKKQLVKETLDKYCAWYREQIKYSDETINEDEESNEIELEDVREQEGEKISNSTETKKTEFNPDRYISEEELEEYCGKIESPFDRMLLRSIYEGFDFSEDGYDIANIRLKDCNSENNAVIFPYLKSRYIVSDELMKDLINCGSISTEELKTNSLLGSKAWSWLAENEEDRCFKMLPSEEKDSSRLYELVKGRIHRIQTKLGVKKISSSNLYYSGFFYMAQKRGIESNFSLMKKYDTQQGRDLLKKYKLEGMRPNNFKRKMSVYLQNNF